MIDQVNDGLPVSRQSNSSDSPQKTMTDLLALPDAERKLMNWLVRKRQATFAEILVEVGEDSSAVNKMLSGLIQSGFLIASENNEATIFKLNLVSRKTRSLPKQVWDALG